MAKGAYIGVSGVARKIKKGYMGIATEFPIYREDVIASNVGITDSNISDFFTVENGNYYFVGSGSTFTTNNGGVKNSVATTKLTAKYEIDVSFDYSYSSEQGWDKFSLKAGSQTILNGVSGTTTAGSWSGHISKGKTIEFTYQKDSSGDKNDDKCTFSNMVVNSATEIIQTGTEIREVARRVKKAYIGIGGVARPCWGGGELEYYGTIAGAAAGLPASTKTHAMFISNSAALAYDATLTMYTPDKLSISTSYAGIASTEVGNYGLFGGGGYMSGVSSFYHSSTVEAYDQSLTRSYAPSLSQQRRNATGSKGGKYGMFAGGQVYNSSGSSKQSSVDAYDESLTKVLSAYSGGISVSRYDMGSTAVGNYILFAGGYSSSYLSVVDAFDESLTRTTPDVLSVSAQAPAAATVGNYALFCGGVGSTTYATVDAYDKSLTRSNAPDLSVARRSLGETAVGNFALFAGGYGSAYVAAVDVYDESLTHTLSTDMSNARMPQAASVGNFALFTGGNNNDVDVYTVV